MSDTLTIASTGNTIPEPPRLSGNSTDDMQAMQAWVGDLHRILAREANVVGTQKAIIDAINALSAAVVVLTERVAQLESFAQDVNTALITLDERLDVHDADTVLFNGLAFMPGSVSGTYTPGELAAAYDKINMIIAILRNP